MKSEAKKAREEKQRLEEQLEKLRLENEVMMKKINQLTAENIQLSEARSQPMASMEKVEGLIMEIKVLKQKLREKAAATSNLPNQGDFSQLLKDKKDLEGRIAALTKKVSQKETRCEQLESDIVILKEGLDHFKHAENTTHLQIDNLHSQIQSLTNELKRAYQSLREVATSTSTMGLALAATSPSTYDAIATDRSPDDLTQRGKRVAYSDYVVLRRENALLKSQISELRRMQVHPSASTTYTAPSLNSPFHPGSNPTPNSNANALVAAFGPNANASSLSASVSASKTTTASIVRDIEELAFSLPEIMNPTSMSASITSVSGSLKGSKRK
eukprot:TRINITY_DN3208_c0_g1_i5.p1 TRINITY_DN3208_c0_g1~~TRINITY_DN3208_c0_g1_i5.p1  ORF type:complete len:329 (+),score=92.54 TRINITY_DN3208_c0_g1_i5:266-1252(+)